MALTMQKGRELNVDGNGIPKASPVLNCTVLRRPSEHLWISDWEANCVGVNITFFSGTQKRPINPVTLGIFRAEKLILDMQKMKHLIL
jgi:hypothetical protein